MHLFKQLWLPFLILTVPAVIFSLFLPYFPVDETRYLSVAWEMRLHDSFIVPLQNALPYSHKPPLLFWLFNLNWLLFGVNESTLRFIPLLFSLLNVSLVFRIALLLWEDERIARHAAIILSSTLSYLLWSSFIMFDVVLTTWVLLALLGLISAARWHSIKWWLLVGFSLGGGLLTKGPVVFVYILPAALLAFLWVPGERFCAEKWYAWLTLSLSLGIAIVLIWLVPAALTGGETYRQAILWGQTVNRVADSFAHKRPVWWYLPWLPVLLLPWILFTPTWRGSSPLAEDAGRRLVIIWIVATVVIFSFVSGKQVHYLIPVLPAFSLLMARNAASCDNGTDAARWHLPVAALYLVLGLVLFSISFLKLGHALQNCSVAELRPTAIGLSAIGSVMFVLKQRSLTTLINYTAVSSALLCVLIVFGGNSFFNRYDLHAISDAVKVKQDAGYQVIHYGKYHGQYQFIGRLQQPLVALESKEAVADYAAKHDKVALITYEPESAPREKTDIFFQQPFRSKQVVLWNKDGISHFINGAGR